MVISLLISLLVVILSFPAIGIAACGGSTSSCGDNCIQAYDSSRDCVVAALAEVAADNTIVRVPAGSSTWASAITMPSDYSWVFQGAGSGSTIISASGNSLITVPSMPDKTWRITGFKFIGPAASSGGVYLIAGASYTSTNACSSFRIDNNIFADCNNLQTSGCIRTGGICYGVIDSNQFIYESLDGTKSAIDINQPDDASWTADLELGGSSAVYIENNYFAIQPGARVYADGSEHNWLCIDSTSGGRYVARYNVFKNCYVASHGTCYNAGVRGNVKQEVYKNWIYHETGWNCTSNPPVYEGGTPANSCDLYSPINALSGTGIVYNNVIEGSLTSSSRLIAFGNNRSGGDCNFADACDGSEAIDENSDGGEGYKCLDQPGVIGAQNSQTSSPWYIWGNHGCSGSVTSASGCETNPKSCYETAYASCITDGATSDITKDGTRFSTLHFIKDRDYYVSAHPTWTEYQYPHPLRSDTTAPGNATYAINTAGSAFTVTFDEAVTHGAGGTTGWVLTSDGGAVTATYSSGAGSTALVYQLSRTVYSTETVTGTYTQPTAGITDIAGNEFATVTDVAITNSSEATAGAPTYPKMTLSTGSNVTLSPSGTGSFTLAP